MTVTKSSFPAIVKRMALCFAGIALLAMTATAQTNTVVFSSTKIAVKQALDQIKTQTGYGIAYNGVAFDTEKVVSLSSSQLTIDAAMKQILAGTGQSYTLSHNMISITKSDAAQPQNKVVSTKSNTTKPAAQPVVDETPMVVTTVAVPVNMAIAPPVLPAPPVENLTNDPYIPQASLKDAYIPGKLPVFAIKTNILYDATTTLNLGIELGLGKRTSLDIPVSVNPWTFDNNKKWNHFLIQPEFRWWTCQRFNGGFWGLHAHYANYNVGGLDSPPFSEYMNQHRFEGWLVGAGISYGYHWIFAPRWSLEATIGAGYAYLDYDKYPCAKCGKKISSETKHYFGPTKVGLNLVFMIK